LPVVASGLINSKRLFASQQKIRKKIIIQTNRLFGNNFKEFNKIVTSGSHGHDEGDVKKENSEVVHVDMKDLPFAPEKTSGNRRQSSQE
jgi:hypothetical protein